MPRVSVLMPVYNAAKHIDAAVSSVLSQTFSDFELVCVDDGSTDGSRAALRRRAAADARIVLVEKPANRGVGTTRNDCLDLARGDYFVFVDSDDELRPTALAECLAAAEAATADIVAFRLELHEPPALLGNKAVHGTSQPPALLDHTGDLAAAMAPVSLHDRYCHGLWEQPFCPCDMPEALFQLGVALNNSLFRLDFVRKAGLRFTDSEVGESLAFVGLSLVAAQRAVLLDKALCRIGWWHGGNLTQRTVGDPKRYYPQLLALKEGLAARGLLEAVRPSYVAFAAALVSVELEAQRESPLFSEAAQFYRVSGLDSLGVLGCPSDWYRDPADAAALRAVVLGAVNNTQEQRIIELTRENKAALAKVKRLTREKERLQKKLDSFRKLRSIASRSSRKALRALRSVFAPTRVQARRLTDAQGGGRQALVDGKMNASTGYRFVRLCELLLELDDEAMAARRAAIASSLMRHAGEVRPFLVYGETALTVSSRVYLALLARLAAALRDEGTGVAGLRERIAALEARAHSVTCTVVRVVFNLEQEPTFPSLESLYTACREDERTEPVVVFAPLGEGINNWNIGSAPLFDRSGPVPVRQKDSYSFFMNSPDLMVVSRPTINVNRRPYCRDKNDWFEIPPPSSAGLRVVYAPYAFFDTISETSLYYGYQYAVHPVAWKILAYSEQIHDNYRKYSELAGSNVIMLGAPRFDVSSGVNGFRPDELTAEYQERIAGRRVLFWNSHFRAVRGSGAIILSYFNHILEYFSNRPELVLFWRPHPMMFASLVEKDFMSQHEADALLERVGAIENVIIDRSKDYINAFALSDALLTDGDSSLPYEYVATGKPVLIHYVHGWNEVSAQRRYSGHMPLLYHRVYDQDGLTHALDAFAAGEDPQQEERMRAARQFIPYNDGNVGNRTMDYLLEEMFKEEDALATSLLYSAGCVPGLRRAMRIRPEDGREETCGRETFATPLFYEAFAGDRLALGDDSYEYAVSCYDAPTFASTLAAPLAPAPAPHPAPPLAPMPAPMPVPCEVLIDSARLNYRVTLPQGGYQQGAHVFDGHAWFRVTVRPANNTAADATAKETPAAIVRFDALPRPSKDTDRGAAQEAGRMGEKAGAHAGEQADKMRAPDELAFALLADTRHVVNGTWEHTLAALREAHRRCALDGILHLGNFTNGCLTREALF
ncbi:MAG: glycosyltransferase, partial [Coriobacteriales bacterium]|nr:glycosyltransferase [Coriobacteriales bacterium]